MGDFSYTLDFKVGGDRFRGMISQACLLSGTFTNAQTGGSIIEFGDDLGATEIIHFHATNLTDNDEEVQIAVSGTAVTMVVGTNDDDGTWLAVVRMSGGIRA